MRFSLKPLMAGAVLAVSILPGLTPAALADCKFQLGFSAIQSQIPQQVGNCKEDEHYNSIGDSNQLTSGGLMAWRKADNWTAFTDGFRTWVNGPNGIQMRLNTQRFGFEANPDNLPVVGGGAATPAPAPAAGGAPTGGGLPPFDMSPDGRFGGIQVSDVPLSNATNAGLGWTREQFLLNGLGSPDPSGFRAISTDQNMPANNLREVGLLNFFPAYCNGGDKMHPCDPAVMGSLAGALAKNRQGKVDTWIAYNEPDICNPANPGYAWNSPNRAQDYYNYGKAVYKGIKAASPGATVVYGSIGLVDPSCQTDKTEMTFWNQWLAIAKADGEAAANNWFFDNLSLNIHKEPEKIYDMLKQYHESMQAAGFDKSIWIMEMGIPVNENVNPATNGDLAVNKDNQKSFLLQAYANAIAGGADHIGIYKMSDFPANDPAYKTIQIATKYMSHVTSAVKSPDNRSRGGKFVDRQDGAVTITMNGPGFQTVVAYNRSLTPVQVRIPAKSNVAMVADKHGNETQVQAQGDSFVLTLDPVTGWFDAPWGERVRFIGGSPLMLRQAA